MTVSPPLFPDHTVAVSVEFGPAVGPGARVCRHPTAGLQHEPVGDDVGVTGLVPDRPPPEIQRLLVVGLVAALGVWLHEYEANEAQDAVDVYLDWREF